LINEQENVQEGPSVNRINSHANASLPSLQKLNIDADTPLLPGIRNMPQKQLPVEYGI